MNKETESPPSYDKLSIRSDSPPSYSTVENIEIVDKQSQITPNTQPTSLTIINNNYRQTNFNRSIENANSQEVKVLNGLLIIGIVSFSIFISFMSLIVPALLITEDSRAIGISTISKYKDLPVSICMGGQNITNIRYSPPYPFNTTATYSPAEMTFQTFAKNGSGHVIPVYGRVPTVYDHIIRKTERCEDNKCEYRLGDLQTIIYKLQAVSNFTCVLDSSGSLFSFESKSGSLNDLYRKYNTAKKLYITGGVMIGLILIFTYVSVWNLGCNVECN